MRATRNGFAAVLVACLLAQTVSAQTTPTQRKGGYFAQVGDTQPTLRNLIPAPLTPPIDSITPMQAAATQGLESNLTGIKISPSQKPRPPVPAPGFITNPPISDPLQSIPSPWNQTPPPSPSTLHEKLLPYWPKRTNPTTREKPTQDQVKSKVPAVRQPSAVSKYIGTISDAAPKAPKVTPRGSSLIPAPNTTQTSPRKTASDRTTLTAQDSSIMAAPIDQATGFQNKSTLPIRTDVSALINGCADCQGNNSYLTCGPQARLAPWEHFTTAWSSGLYLRPRNADIAYAVPIDGVVSSVLTNPIQVGQVDIVDPDYSLGYDLGFNLAINCLTSIGFEYMSLRSSTSNGLETDSPNVLRSLVSHPSSSSPAVNFGSATGSLGIDMDVIDLSLRHLFVGSDVFAINYSVGARYTRLEQRFNSLFASANGTEEVDSDVDFDGGGIRLGIDLQRFACNRNVYFYSNAAASFMAGRFQTQYEQQQSFDPTLIETSWEAGRVVPILDLELGAGWASPCGRFKISLGYLYNAWFNTVKNDDFIQAVQQNNFNGLSNTLSFDGLVGRAEVSF